MQALFHRERGGVCEMMCAPSRIDTDAFYRESCEAGFVKLSDIARNKAWIAPTTWGDLQITINLSKPEKDPAAIAAAAAAPAQSAERCALCVTQADIDSGYARNIELGGQPWALWYRPYAYFNEHCIAMSWEHRPMRIDEGCLARLLDFVDLFPQYFVGSNADLPIVGGSILSHDHFQGGKHAFPMDVAPIAETFELKAFPHVEMGVLAWPVSVIRLRSTERAELLEAACHIMRIWRDYDDAAVGIVSHSGATRHNTITPIVHKRGSTYELDIALRCNVTTDEYPLGVFHPHAELHHIKKENIGLIEVMGLAILPPRVQNVMSERGLSEQDVAELFARVLETSGVFKWDDAGRAAAKRFVGWLDEKV